MYLLKKIKDSSFFYSFRLISYVRRETKRRLIINFILILLSALLEAVTILSVTNVADLIVDNTSQQKTEVLNSSIFNYVLSYLNFGDQNIGIIFFIIFILLSGISRIFIIWFNNKTAAKVGNDLGTRAFSNIIYWPYLKHIQRDSSELIASLTQFTKVALSTITSFIMLCTALIISLSLSIVLLSANFKITIFIIFILSLTYLLNNLLTRSVLDSISKTTRNERINILKLIQNAIGELRDIIIYNFQADVIEQFQKKDFIIKTNAAKAKFISLYPKFLVETVLIVSIIYIYSTQQVRNVETLAIFFFGTLRLLPYLQLIHQSFSTMKYGAYQTKDFLSIVKEKSIASKKISFQVPLKKIRQENYNKLKLDSINFKYPNQKEYVIKNFNLEIKKGEFISLIGSSGCGKSTILDILMGFLLPQKGEFKLDEKLIFKNGVFKNLSYWQQFISHVPQKIFISNKSLAENIAMKNNLELSEEEIDKINSLCSLVFLDDLLKSHPQGINQPLGENGNFISGGQSQKIGIARALFWNLPFLILDEATNAIDLETEKYLLQNIRNFNTNQTIIMVTHSNQSFDLCDNIIDLGSMQK